MNAKISVFAICAEAIIYLLIYNLHDCTFKVSYHNEFAGQLINYVIVIPNNIERVSATDHCLILYLGLSEKNFDLLFSHDHKGLATIFLKSEVRNSRVTKSSYTK